MPALYLEGSGISMDVFTTLEYSEGELFGADLHGLGTTVGVKLSFFDVIGITYSRTWYTHNDLDDFDTISVVVGLYGGLGESRAVNAMLRPQPNVITK